MLDHSWAALVGMEKHGSPSNVVGADNLPAPPIIWSSLNRTQVCTVRHLNAKFHLDLTCDSGGDRDMLFAR